MTASKPAAQKTSFRRTIRQLASLAPKGRRARWVLLALLSAFTAGIEAVGGLLIFGVLELVQGGESRVAETLESAIRWFYPSVPDSRVTIVLLIGAALFFVFRSAVLVFLTYSQSRIAQSEGVRISHQLVGGYLSADYEFHLSVDPSVLIRNVMVSVDDTTIRFLVPVSRIFSESLTIVALVSVLLVSAPYVTLLAAGSIGLAAWIVMRVVRPKFHAIGRQNQDLSSRLLGNLTESFEGIRDVIVTGSRWRYLQDFKLARMKLARTRVARFTYDALPRYTLETLLVVGVLIFLSFQVSVDATEESIALIGLFAYTALRTLPAVNRITQSINNVRYSQAAVDDVLDDLRTAPPTSVHKREDVEPLAFTDALELSDVYFRYAGSDRLILDDIDLRLAAGESVGIAGPTGSGKSTLVDIFLGLLQPTKGQVEVDGEPLDTVVHEWHSAIGVVSQKVFLANSSLARNIALTERGEDIDRDRIRECVRISQLEGLVAELTDGIDTVIGGSGVRLSGGERQRVAVARALYRNPSVLFLDEATSAIDGSTEAALISAIRAENPSRTLVMVAHRVNTLRDCHKIVVMREGRIEAVGTYDDLMQTNEVFMRMSLGTET